MPPGGNKGGGGGAGSSGSGSGGSGGKNGLNAVRGTNNADLLIGTDAADMVDGKGGDDTLFGGLGNDLIEGDKGNDVLIGGAGDDHLDGGHDTDSALYMDDSAGTSSSDPDDYYSVFGYDIAIGPNGTTITDQDAADGDTGVDTLVAVENAVFSDNDADGDGTAELITVHLDGQNNAVLAVADSGAGDEDTAIVYDAGYLIANDIDFDGDAKELISVQDAVNGTVSLAADGTVTFIPNADYSGEASFTYTVTDGKGGTDTQIVSLDIAAVVDAPILEVAPAMGDEDTPIALNLSAAPSDADGSEILSSLLVSAIPVGATLSDGVNSFTAVAGDTEIDIFDWNQSSLTITPPADSDVDFELTVTAEAMEVSNGDTKTTSEPIAVTVNAIADAPTLDLNDGVAGDQLAIGVSGDEDTAIAFDVSSALSDTDGSETLSLVVSAIPVGATLTDGTEVFVASAGDTEVDISTWNWTSMMVTPPLNSGDDFQLTVTATATEFSNSDTATTVGTIDVGVTGTVDAPTLDLDANTAGDQSIGAASGDEDTAIAVDLTAALSDTDGSETLSLVVSAIPVGATLSDGINSFTATGTGTEVDIAAWNQAALTITPPADSDGDFQLTVTATATEGGAGGATASTAGTIDVTVNAVADAPEIDLDAPQTGAQNVGAAEGQQGKPIALDVAASVSDTDGSESLTSLVVSNIPVDAILSDGVNSFTATAGDTDVDILGWDLNALTVTPLAGNDVDFQLLVTATSTESSNGDTNWTQGSIDVTVLGEIGAPTIDLGALATSAGFSIFGADNGDQVGWSVSDAGDINGDGFGDIILGALNGDGLADAKLDAGESYVIFGKVGGFGDIDLGALAPADGFMIGGAATGDHSGNSVSSAGDINGDGFADIIIGASESDGTGGPDDGDGESYVIFGKAGGFTDIDLGSLSGADGFTISGAEAGDKSGFSVASAGDIDGDGFDDLIIGAYLADDAGVADAGQSYVIFGQPGGFSDIDLGAIAPGAGFTITGGGAGDQAGWSVSSAGDVNGDGFDDIIVGALRGDGIGDAEKDAGESYVIFGKASGFSDIDVSTLAPADGFTIRGADAGDRAGYSVSSAGDVNRDGYEDVIIGAIGGRGAGNATMNSGEAYVVFGKASGLGDVDLGALAPTDGFVIRGSDPVDSLGRSVSSAGDINGDGFDDIIVGAWFADGINELEPNAGESYVIFGKKDGFGPIEVDALTPTEGFTILGATTGDSSGAVVSAAGDIDGDGYDDVIVSAPLADGVDDLSVDAGDSYVIFGGNLTGAVTHEGTAASETLVGTIDADVMVAGQGDDTVTGGGGADVLIGGAGNDLLSIGDTNFARIDGGTGYDTVVLEGAGESLDLTLLGSAEIEGVEAFDLSGTGDNELTLNAQDVLQLSDETNDLRILGDGGDNVILEGDFAAAGQEIIDGTTYDVYASASTDARVLTEVTDVTVNLVIV
ncbi:MAG: cadherin-like domain-containing protein [Alphaproteobacteria bacterium]|nr:cadherin-like domain-containing protein [Alphaproteobacteria bacterium]